MKAAYGSSTKGAWGRRFCQVATATWQNRLPQIPSVRGGAAAEQMLKNLMHNVFSTVSIK